jgi:hypothetical protein
MPMGRFWAHQISMFLPKFIFNSNYINDLCYQ